MGIEVPFDDEQKYANKTTRRIQVDCNANPAASLQLETVHCPICQAVPEYCPGHWYYTPLWMEGNDGSPRLVERLERRREPGGTMVPQSARVQPSLKRIGFVKNGYGRFSGDPVARWTKDGSRMMLLEDFSYTDRTWREWIATKGTILDGASIPRVFWTIVGAPYNGKYRYASIVHDYECIQRENPWKTVHRMFYEACLCAGCSESHAKMLYYAVYHFGPRWGHDDAKTNRGQNNLTATDIATVRQFVEQGKPTVKEIVQTTPQAIGVVRRYGRRGLGGPIKLGPKLEGDE